MDLTPPPPLWTMLKKLQYWPVQASLWWVGGWIGQWWCWSQRLNNDCSVPVLLDGEASTVTLHVLSAGFPSHQKSNLRRGRLVLCTSTQVGRGMSSKVPLQKRRLLSPCNRQEYVDDDDGDGGDFSRDSKSKYCLCENIMLHQTMMMMMREYFDA